MTLNESPITILNSIAWRTLGALLLITGPHAARIERLRLLGNGVLPPPGRPVQHSLFG